jgi:deoxyhypusine synthase
MTGTELRHLLGKVYGEQEKKLKVQPGLLSTCHRLAVPILVGAPGDGSLFLNSMKLWAMKQAGLIPDYKFELDLHAEVLESCAYHYWGLFENPTRRWRRSSWAAACRRTTTCSPSRRSARCSA